ncbi:MAG TPA: flagellar hook-associated protein FlgL [Steroidobacteraceae bacterium]|nr:flagellar hook-associated protein FlgL [Steroidobacteraceae bacterium]HRX90568.1 flagellar hook-associated protein FlgL [Steroidobacteraceae bacterium]
MRISTLGWNRNTLEAMLDQQARLARTQADVATGLRVRTPADDPIAATRIAGLERNLAASEQFARNANYVESRLGNTEQALADGGNVLQRVRELLVQAGNATVGPDERRMITAELRTRIDELMATANRTDGTGEYLFAGTATQTQPFSRDATGVRYGGDSTVREIQISATQRLADGVTGLTAFMSAPRGNGTFTTAVAAGNTGSGSIDIGSVVDPAAWVADTYRIRFIAPGSYEVVDSASNTVSTGSYTSGNAIEFQGVRVSIAGAPAVGDEFVVASASRGSLFSLLDSIATTLDGRTATPAEKARFASEVGAGLAGLDGAIDSLLQVRAQVGARLSAVDSTANTRASLELELQGDASALRDTDYAEAVTRLNQQYAGLQAAQAAYTKIAQLSLFDYL